MRLRSFPPWADRLTASLIVVTFDDVLSLMTRILPTSRVKPIGEDDLRRRKAILRNAGNVKREQRGALR